MESAKVMLVSGSTDASRLVSEGHALPGLELLQPRSTGEAVSLLGGMRRGAILLDFSDPEEALTFLRRAAELRPDLPVIGLASPRAATHTSEAVSLGVDAFLPPEATGEELSQAIRDRVDPERIAGRRRHEYEHRVHLARERLRERQMNAAAEHARRAMCLAPSRPEAYNLLGVVEEALQRRPEALKFYRMALDADPTYELAQRNAATASKPPGQRGPAEFE